MPLMAMIFMTQNRKPTLLATLMIAGVISGASAAEKSSAAAAPTQFAPMAADQELASIWNDADFQRRLIGSYGRFGPSSLDPWLIRDRAAARASLERILAWDFDRVVVAHGAVLEHGGRDALRRGYRWLLTDPA